MSNLKLELAKKVKSSGCRLKRDLNTTQGMEASQYIDYYEHFHFEGMADNIILFPHFGKTRDPYLHNHNFFELFYVYKGSCLNILPEKEMVLSEGDFMLLNPNALHSPFTPSDENTIINIIIKPSVFEDVMLSLIADNKLFSNFFVNYLYHINMTSNYLYFPKDDEYPTKFIVDMLIKEYISHDICCTSVMQAILVKLFATLSRSYRKLNQEILDDTPKSQLVVDIIAYINQNISNVSLKSLSEQFQYSTSYISKIITNYTGKNFSDIVHFLRLNQSKKYLENKNLTINEITQMVGFSDANYFYKVFKARFHMSPSEYRKQIYVDLSAAK
ncbi:AraC family transcriptional regulator [Massilioclostridium coli]|uniref:AraC family transcriptional regulator n=1 Tax=Massilioclostridium coli TaxID=1870991 RepID=UPI00085CD73A|nr:AraC family transcriptional regulator [Massilioclostridium coli]